MLLKLEVDGFKNLVDFSASFGPFTCIAGENGVGKSNVFDAIDFLSLTAEHPLLEAAGLVRASGSDPAGDPEHLFTAGLGRRAMRFAAEIVVPTEVTDDFGEVVAPSISLLRYELEIGVDEPNGSARQGRLVVEREELRHINRGDAAKHLRFPHDARQFRPAVVVGERRGGPFISTEVDNDRITLHQDGGSRGRPKRALPSRAPTTVVSTINSADAPTVLAVRRELQSWRRLALEPSALRAPDRFVDPASMTPDGRHLPATLERIARTTAGASADDVYTRVANRVAGLAGLDVRAMWVDSDDVRQLLTVVVRDRSGRELPARSLSEGTLRYLALCVLLEDPQSTGVITMEEAENGIHPANLEQVIDLVRDLAVDPTLPPAPDNPLRQVIVNTHSPAVVRVVGEPDLLYARIVPRSIDGVMIDTLQLLPMNGTWRADDADVTATRADLLPYLASPPGSQISFFDVA